MLFLEWRDYFIRAGGSGAWILLLSFGFLLFGSTRFPGSIWFIVGASLVLVGQGAEAVGYFMGMGLYGHFILAEVLSWHGVVSTAGTLIFTIGFIRCATRIRRLVRLAWTTDGFSDQQAAEQDGTSNGG